MVKTKLKKNDQVVVNTGSDKGKRGKILVIDAAKGKVIVEGINKKTKFYKDSQDKTNSRIMQIERPVNLSNVEFFCEKCKKGVRLTVEKTETSKKRICKKCGKSID
ncbi:MAG: 50S ribosomal protein L24 [Spirochaetes bacterium]|nr:50S ribosomal protein L24 [Spirochaetota bacterium]